MTWTVADRRTWYARNKERHYSMVLAWRRRNFSKVRDWKLRYKYGIVWADVVQIMERQDGKCAVCGNPFSKTPHIDHDHACCPGERSCGKCVRGLLCAGCNIGVGWYERQAQRIASYLHMALH